jgi:hypothetical protein
MINTNKNGNDGKAFDSENALKFVYYESPKILLWAIALRWLHENGFSDDGLKAMELHRIVKLYKRKMRRK